MKSISQFIRESLISEAEEAIVRFKLYGCDDSKKTAEKVSAEAQKAGIYYEPVDGGFKLKIKPGQNVSGIESAIKSLIEGLPEDKKEELQSKTDAIEASISKMKEAASASDGE